MPRPLMTSAGKDKSVFVTREDVEKEQVLSELVEDDTHGIILPNGDINWDCPCLGGMAYGSCGQEFKDAFSCFHNRYVHYVMTLLYPVHVTCIWSHT